MLSGKSFKYNFSRHLWNCTFLGLWVSFASELTDLFSEFGETCAHQLLVQVLPPHVLRHQGPMQPDEQSPEAVLTEASLSWPLLLNGSDLVICEVPQTGQPLPLVDLQLTVSQVPEETANMPSLLTVILLKCQRKVGRWGPDQFFCF